MLALDTRSRAALAGAALLVLAAAMARDPIAARSAPPAIAPARHEVLPAPRGPALVVPRRNPFEGDAPPNDEHTAPPLPLQPVPAALAPLPPNAAIAAGGATERLTAIVSGSRPYALLEAANRTRVVTVGERIDGATVRAIGIDGVRLSDGKTLTIGAATSAALAVPTTSVPPPRASLSPGGPL